MKKSISKSLFPALLLFFHSVCFAQVSLPKVFGNDMVLQRDRPIPVWGNASPGTVIAAELGSVRATAKTGKDGKWMVHFPKCKAGGPYDLKISEPGKPEPAIKLSGILIGDVWVASGQSNMEWPVQQAKDAQKEIRNADFPQVRFFVVAHDKQLTPQADVLSGKWEICDTANVKQFSAVAYYFARKLFQDQNVPIGIIQSTWGGTPVESWTSREMLLTSPISRARVASNDTLTPQSFITDNQNGQRYWDIIFNSQKNIDKIIRDQEYNETDWKEIEMPKLVKDFGIGPYEGMVWLRKEITLPASFTKKDITINLGRPEMNYSLYFNGEEICKNVWNGNPTHSYTIPAGFLKSGENTISLRIAMLWGGGGLNPPAADINITDGSSKISLAGKWLYNKSLEPSMPKVMNYQNYPTLLFNGMINPLIPYSVKGFIWYQGEANDWDAYNYRKLFPMMIADWRQRWGQGNLPFLYVQLANFKQTKSVPSESEWAELREAQTMTLSQPNTGMACIIDIGDANDIHPSNKQEVGRRLALLAGKLVYNQNYVASGPIYKGSRKEGDRIRVHFTNTGSGLSIKDGKELRGFAIAGKDKQFHWAKAIIEGNDVVVYAGGVADPEAVRYAWADNPDCNLVNAEGLPAIPFRTDNWKGLTQR